MKHFITRRIQKLHNYNIYHEINNIHYLISHVILIMLVIVSICLGNLTTTRILTSVTKPPLCDITSGKVVLYCDTTNYTTAIVNTDTDTEP